jgi:hypothetical protein
MIESELDKNNIIIDEITTLNSSIIGKIAINKITNNCDISNRITPLYLKKSSAELEKEKIKK